MAAALPNKFHHGDPLLEAATRQHNHLEDCSLSDTPRYDPVFMDLMIHGPVASLPLHSYYSEFRLGQGDPLLKAAMEHWPCTSVESSEHEEECFHHYRQPWTRALTTPPCFALAKPLDISHMNNVGHLAEGEKRFILISEDRRYVVVDRDFQQAEEKE